MVNNDKIKQCFTGLVGWRESAKASNCYQSLTNELKESSSGLFYNGISGITLEKINNLIQKDFNSVNQYLSDIQNDCISELTNRLVQNIKTKIYTKELLNNYDFSIYVEKNKKLTLKYNRFVGFLLRPHHSNSITAQITSLGGIFKKQQILPIYFYSSLQNEPIYIFNVDINKEYSFVPFNLSQQTSGSLSASGNINPTELILSYIDKDKGSGATYYIGYYESDLDSDNFAVQTIYPAGGCTSCGNNSYTKHLEYVSVYPISIEVGNTYSDKSLFDTDAIGYQGETFGLKMSLNVKCDITDVICENKIMFAKALQKMVATRILWDMYGTTEQNHISATQKNDFKMLAEKYENELYGYVVDGRTIKGELEFISIDLSNIDAQCLGARKGVMGLMNL